MAVLGNTSVGGTIVEIDGGTDGQKAGGKFTLPADTPFNYGYAYLASTISADGSESQPFRLCVYRNSDGAFVAASNTLNLNGSFAPGWQEFSFPAIPTLTAGDYWLLLHADVSSGPMRWGYAVDTSGGVFFEDQDTFLDAPEDPLGTNTTANPGYLFSAYLDYRAPQIGTPFGDSSLRSEPADVQSVFVGGSRYSFSFDPNLSAYGLTGLWASDPINAAVAVSIIAVTQDAGWLQYGFQASGYFPWAALEIAGLRVQVRMLCLFGNLIGDGTLLEAQALWYGVDEDADPASSQDPTPISASLLSAPPAHAYQMRDTGWVDLDSGYTARKFIRFGWRLQKVGGTLAAHATPTVAIRWVG